MFWKSSQISQEIISVGVFFSKVEGPQNCNVIKERLQHRFIRQHLFCRGSMNGWFWKTNASFQKQLFLQNISVAASDSFRFPSCNFIQKETGAEMFICEICKFLENIFWQNTTCEFWEVLGHLFYKAPFGNCLFHLQVAEFQPPHTVKKYCTSAFQAFYTRRKSCSKAFIYLKSLKIICEEVKL